ncbi:MAG: DM13 domain-containing protein [Crocosphaera sp.]
MKLSNGLAWLVIFFVAVGCNTIQEETANNPPSTVELNENDQQEQSNIEEPTNVKVGSFVSGEHPTEGTVRLVSEEGQTLIELDSDFKTSEMGPDLVVILHRSSDVIGSTNPPAYPLKEGDYVVVAPLSQFSGTQQYIVPEDIKTAEYQSVAIWCRKFNATFGAAIVQ